ncbi:hypothetical protein NQ314_015772 [Rhamnusium bicolor]|uniref:Neuroendocrine protein 7B2 n=1 Tax=Rhamnusium bicolor TaxID=1586634 RepID=A0AAV8WYK9_9CUCU|nr:hypothetical protein NQ314_015772 [Rhamnusium bicolor]
MGDYVSGGAGEGNQLLRPEGLKNKQEVKTDSTLPAYCNPPNPCPVGYSGEFCLILCSLLTSEYFTMYHKRKLI